MVLSSATITKLATGETIVVTDPAPFGDIETLQADLLEKGYRLDSYVVNKWGPASIFGEMPGGYNDPPVVLPPISTSSGGLAPTNIPGGPLPVPPVATLPNIVPRPPAPPETATTTPPIFFLLILGAAFLMFRRA